VRYEAAKFGLSLTVVLAPNTVYYRCTSTALADCRSADNWRLTIGRLLANYQLIQKVTKT